MAYKSTHFKGNKFLISLLFSLLLVFPLTSLSQEETKKGKQKLSSLEKSILIPGWGQIAEKKYLEGITFFTLEAIAIAGIIVYARKGNKYYHSYKEATSMPDAMKYRELSERYDIRRNKFILVAGAIWALNLLDMYLIYQKKNKNLFIFLGVDEKNSFFIKIIKHF